MLATLVKVGHALRVSLALHGPTFIKLSHEIDKLSAWPLSFVMRRHILEVHLIMAVSLNIDCPAKNHWINSEGTGQ